MRTVVVLPLVPVTASQGAASGPRRRQASSTSPQISTARLGGGQEERLVGLPAGCGDDQLGALGEGRAVAEADGDAERLEFGGLGAGAVVIAVVDDGDVGPEAPQHACCGDPGDAETRDGHPLAGPGRVCHLSAAQPA